MTYPLTVTDSLARLRFRAKPLARWLAVLLLLALLGCGGPARKKDDSDKQALKQEDPLTLAREVLRRGGDANNCKQAIELMNASLALNADALGKEEKAPRELLTDRFGLSDDESKEIEAKRFTALDVQHLEFALLTRDIVRSFPLQSRSKLDQARLLFDWTMRHVALREIAPDLDPPAWVLKRGWGNGRERALVFLALIQQIDLDGALLSVPEKKGGRRYPFVGVLVDGECYLFDPYLGLPVPGPKGSGQMTLARFKTWIAEPGNEGLWPSHGLKFLALADLEVALVPPLSSLSPRMRFLEKELLTGPDRLRLANDPAVLMKTFEKEAPGKVRVWNQRPEKGKPIENSPVRVLRFSLPPSEGGVDNGARLARFQETLLPWPQITASLLQQGLLKELPANAGGKQLNVLLGHIYQQFALEPRELLQRGKLTEANKRLGQVMAILDEIEQDVAGTSDAELSAKIVEWREQVRAAALALLEKKPNAEGQWQVLWNADHFLSTLFLNQEERAKTRDPDQKGRDRLPRTALSAIVYKVLNEPLRSETSCLQALRWHDQAERDQLRKASGEAGSAWKNAQEDWHLFVYRGPGSPDPRPLNARLENVRSLIKAGQVLMAVNLLDRVMRDLSQGLHGRWQQAQALARGGDNAGAKRVLTELSTQLTELQKSPELTGLRDELVKSFAPNQRDVAQVLLERVYCDFQPQGTLHWLGAAVTQRLASLN